MLLDEDDTIGVRGASSRGICYAQKTLEIFARLGIYERMPREGDHLVGRQDASRRRRRLLVRPAASERVGATAVHQPPAVLRRVVPGRPHRASSAAATCAGRTAWSKRHADRRCVTLQVETPAGRYTLEADGSIDASGVQQPDPRAASARRAQHRACADRWCITDVRFKERFPAERWTWVEAPFNESRAVWQHLMADDVWRLDYQMASDATPSTSAAARRARKRAARAARRRRRVRARLGRAVRVPRAIARRVPPRPRVLHRRRRARREPVRRARRQLRHPGRRQPRLEACARADGQAPDAACSTPTTPSGARRRSENLRGHQPHGALPGAAIGGRAHVRAAVIDLAREHPFARLLVNTGRLSVGESLPRFAGGRKRRVVAAERPDRASRWLTVDLVGLAQSVGTMFVGILYAPTRGRDIAAMAQLEARGCRFDCSSAARAASAIPVGKLRTCSKPNPAPSP